jgi:hypothetical protein
MTGVTNVGPPSTVDTVNDVVAADIDRWQAASLFLRIACRFAEFPELRDAVGHPDPSVVSERLATEPDLLAARKHRNIVAQAITAVTRAPFLFTQKQWPMWRRLATLLDQHVQWMPKLRLCLLVGIPLAIVGAVGSHYAKAGSFNHWLATVKPSAAKASALQQQNMLLMQDAAAVGAFPAGASAHAHNALKYLSQNDVTLAHLIASSEDIALLQDVYRRNPDADAIVKEDDAEFPAIALNIKRAQSEMELAQEVLHYSQKWGPITVPASLPPDLGPAWSANASAMEHDYITGDITDMDRIDKRLDYLVQGGQKKAEADAILATFHGNAYVQASALIAPLDSLIAAGEKDQVDVLLARLSAMQSELPLVYGLRVMDGDGEHAGVVRALDGTPASQRDYILVQAINPRGEPITVSVYDTELNKLIPAQRFGIEVSPDLFAQFKAQVQANHSQIVVGVKESGDAIPTYSIPVLNGRITSW